jgi:hypothetical protein
VLGAIDMTSQPYCQQRQMRVLLEKDSADPVPVSQGEARMSLDLGRDLAISSIVKCLFHNINYIAFINSRVLNTSKDKQMLIIKLL